MFIIRLQKWVNFAGLCNAPSIIPISRAPLLEQKVHNNGKLLLHNAHDKKEANMQIESVLIVDSAHNDRRSMIKWGEKIFFREYFLKIHRFTLVCRLKT